MAYFVDRYKTMLVDHEFGDTSCKREDVTSIQQTIDFNKGWDQNNDIDFWNRPHNYTNRINMNGEETEGYSGVCNSLLMASCNDMNKLGICNTDYSNTDTMYLNVYNKKLAKKSLYKNMN